MCPVNALKKLLAGLPDEPDLPLFSFYDVHVKLSSLKYSIFVKCLKAALQKAGVNPDQYSGHSLRRGGCSFAFSLGIPPLLIKLRGDWKSNAYERYVHVNQKFNVDVAKVLSLACCSAS